jgi:hypothetical protein
VFYFNGVGRKIDINCGDCIEDINFYLLQEIACFEFAEDAVHFVVFNSIGMVIESCQ